MLEPQPVGDYCRNSPGMPLIVYPQKPFPTAPNRCVVRFPHKYVLTTRRLAKNYTPVRADTYSDRRECIRKAVLPVWMARKPGEKEKRPERGSGHATAVIRSINWPTTSSGGGDGSPSKARQSRISLAKMHGPRSPGPNSSVRFRYSSNKRRASA